MRWIRHFICHIKFRWFLWRHPGKKIWRNHKEMDKKPDDEVMKIMQETYDNCCSPGPMDNCIPDNQPMFAISRTDYENEVLPHLESYSRG